jgi:lysine 2,3-aminomutase
MHHLFETPNAVSTLIPSKPWKKESEACLTNPNQLPLEPKRRQRMEQVTQRFPMKIPAYLAGLIDWANPRCPIRRQLVPDVRELAPAGVPDPLEEEQFSVASGVIQRFQDRLLALVSNACPALCRHCNRKRYWTCKLQTAKPEDIGQALSRRRRIKEVILSGGDPLMLKNSSLDLLLQAARSKEGIELVRIHSRAPVSFPARITKALVQMLSKHQPVWFCTHFNHAKEVTPEAGQAVLKLNAAGICVLNQAVLLKGVNDSVTAQAQLGRALLRVGVKPHYLFQLDRAQGTLHFQVPLKKSVNILANLQAHHSGLLVPHLLVDLPGRGGKVPITTSSIIRMTPKGAWIKGTDGKQVFYESS